MKKNWPVKEKYQWKKMENENNEVCSNEIIMNEKQWNENNMNMNNENENDSMKISKTNEK